MQHLAVQPAQARYAPRGTMQRLGLLQPLTRHVHAGLCCVIPAWHFSRDDSRMPNAASQCVPHRCVSVAFTFATVAAGALQVGTNCRALIRHLHSSIDKMGCRPQVTNDAQAAVNAAADAAEADKRSQSSSGISSGIRLENVSRIAACACLLLLLHSPHCSMGMAQHPRLGAHMSGAASVCSSGFTASALGSRLAEAGRVQASRLAASLLPMLSCWETPQSFIFSVKTPHLTPTACPARVCRSR
jgi:hypothetical protein